MTHKHRTTEEQDFEHVCKNAVLPVPRREVVQAILDHYTPPVTLLSVNRIPNQENLKGRSIVTHFFESMLMPWKKIIPVGALALVLIVAVANKPTSPTTKKTTPFETKITSGPLVAYDVDVAVDELAAELLSEEALTDEADLASIDSLLTYETIYETNDL